MKPLSRRSNVVPFRQPTQSAPHYLLLTTLVDPNPPLEGDLVAFYWPRKDGTPGEVLFWHWWGPTGRGEHGRFVKKGSPEEYYGLGCMKYHPARDPIKILGRVMGARDDGGRLTLPPRVS
jgi:hypothetical protein